MLCGNTGDSSNLFSTREITRDAKFDPQVCSGADSDFCLNEEYFDPSIATIASIPYVAKASPARCSRGISRIGLGLTMTDTFPMLLALLYCIALKVKVLAPV